MTNQFLALLKREVWEHRSIYATPLAIATIVLLGVMTMLALVSGFAKELDAVIFGAANIAGETGRKAALTMIFVGTSWLFIVGVAILTVFYSLDSLYAERKDKSILFWRSLPVTDAQTVVSKLVTALFVIPIAAIVGIVVTHILNLIVIAIWVSMKGGDAGLLIWGSVPLLDNWLAALIVVLASGLWMSPFVGWFLFVSAYTKRSPLLMAFMPLILISLLEKILLRTHYFAENVLGRGDGMPIFRSNEIERLLSNGSWREATEEITSLLSHLDLVRFFTSTQLWAGIVVCGILTTGAIYIRRYRDES